MLAGVQFYVIYIFEKCYEICHLVSVWNICARKVLLIATQQSWQYSISSIASLCCCIYNCITWCFGKAGCGSWERWLGCEMERDDKTCPPLPPPPHRPPPWNRLWLAKKESQRSACLSDQKSAWLLSPLQILVNYIVNMNSLCWEASVELWAGSDV